MKRSYYCYILRCADGTFYTGVTTDLKRRLEEHNEGRGSRYTAARRPVRLAWKEKHPDRSSAQKRESAIKRRSRLEKKRLIEEGAGGVKREKMKS
jgi:putative endonuclease